jgi:hypothetical protein
MERTMTIEYKTHFRGEDAICILTNLGPRNYPKDHPHYRRISAYLKDMDFRAIENIISGESNICVHHCGLYYDSDGFVYIDDKRLPKSLSEVVLSLADRNYNFDSVRKFWSNLIQNPSQESQDRLYDFLEANHCPITEDGCFIAYKGVNENLYDMHTNTIFNGPGEVVKMPREYVDSNSNKVCSHGLHAAAWEYASGFGNNTVEVKINPKNVVAVPPDYNFQKMRVCEYYVIRQVESENNQLVYGTENDSFGEDEEELSGWNDIIEYNGEVIEEDDEDLEGLEDFDSFSIDVKVSNRGRVNIPNSITSALGALNRIWINVGNVPGAIQISSESDPYAESSYSYSVDSNGRFKISSKVLKAAGMDGIENFTITVEGAGEAHITERLGDY